MKKTAVLNMFSILLFVSLSTIIFTSFNGCSNNTITNSPEGLEYEVNAYNYSNYHYFLDTAYKSSFKDYMEEGQLNLIENINRQVSNENFEVWVQTTNTTADRKFASLLIDLPPVSAGGNYDSSYYHPIQIPGKRYFGYFRKLSPSEYIMNYQAGFVSFKIFSSENDFAGVTYKEIGTQLTYGTNSITFERDTLVLKMVKAGNINPETDTLAWEMKMKNIYRLPVSNINRNNFSFNVYYRSPLTLILSAYLPGDGPLIEALGLGQYIPPDITVFNYISGRTLYPETGDIIFPSLQPFYTTVLNASGGDSTVAFKDLYTKTQSVAVLSPKANLYVLKGKVIVGQ